MQNAGRLGAAFARLKPDAVIQLIGLKERGEGRKVFYVRISARPIGHLSRTASGTIRWHIFTLRLKVMRADRL